MLRGILHHLMSVPPVDTPPTEDFHQCCNDSPGEGCGLLFPGKTSAGLCQKCTLLDSLQPNSDKYQQALVCSLTILLIIIDSSCAGLPPVYDMRCRLEAPSIYRQVWRLPPKVYVSAVESKFRVCSNHFRFTQHWLLQAP